MEIELQINENTKNGNLWSKKTKKGTISLKQKEIGVLMIFRGAFDFLEINEKTK